MHNKAMIKSVIEIYDCTTGTITKVWEDTALIEAPNWTKDDKLIVNSEGLLYVVDYNNNTKTQINTDFATRCNNDHGITPDGKRIIISSHDALATGELAWQSSRIYSLPIEGGIPTVITPLAGSFWHGVSPGGKEHTYTALRQGKWNIYKIHEDTQIEEQLTNSTCHNDGAEFSPDGKYIYYNSYESGNMEIWRMDSDGTHKMQLTRDEFSNWFPHVSPCNTKFVFLSYIENQQELHPFGKQVLLRSYNIATGTITQLTQPFYGGQGTINVNSWAACGTRFAYIRYIKM